mgnify:CR=1 FL=1
MYTYVQRPGCKKENTATYVHTGRVSNAYSCIRTAMPHVHGWVGTEKQRRRCVHGEATECVVFMGSQQNVSCSRGGVWRTAKRRKWTSYGRNGGPVDREECGVLQNEGNRPLTVETGVLLIGRGMAYRKTEETDLLRSKWGSC